MRHLQQFLRLRTLNTSLLIYSTIKLGLSSFRLLINDRSGLIQCFNKNLMEMSWFGSFKFVKLL